MHHISVMVAIFGSPLDLEHDNNCVDQSWLGIDDASSRRIRRSTTHFNMHTLFYLFLSETQHVHLALARKISPDIEEHSCQLIISY